jgi:hypothetical protein
MIRCNNTHTISFFCHDKQCRNCNWDINPHRCFTNQKESEIAKCEELPTKNFNFLAKLFPLNKNCSGESIGKNFIF